MQIATVNIEENVVIDNGVLSTDKTWKQFVNDTLHGLFMGSGNEEPAAQAASFDEIMSDDICELTQLMYTDNHHAVANDEIFIFELGEDIKYIYQRID